MLRKEREAVDGARLILSTLTNAYFSPLMEHQRFEVVIVEEASMAVLPGLFYCDFPRASTGITAVTFSLRIPKMTSYKLITGSQWGTITSSLSPT